jgi:hypothetical protein
VNKTTRTITFLAIKVAIIVGILGTVFVRIFLVSVDWIAVGPTSGAEAGDLPIQEAHLDESRSLLFLVTTDRWARLELKQQDGGISIHWSDFIVGKPSAAQFTNTVPVSVMTAQDRITEIPEGFSAALYSGPPVNEDNRYWVESYSLLYSRLQHDGLHDVKFSYNPWVKTVSFHPPGIAFLLYGPSYFALCIALPLAFSKVRASIGTVLFIIAFVLHLVSSLLFLVLIGVGEAWSGYGEHHDLPLQFMGSGFFVLMVLVFIWIARNSDSQERNRP